MLTHDDKRMHENMIGNANSKQELKETLYEIRKDIISKTSDSNDGDNGGKQYTYRNS